MSGSTSAGTASREIALDELRQAGTAAGSPTRGPASFFVGVPDGHRVSFMYSYPNLISERPRPIRRPARRYLLYAGED